jgi:prepilin-type processing-associated H-X9-DG protein
VFGVGWEIPVFGSEMNNAWPPSWLEVNWATYGSHAFRHPNLTANILYLDGHVDGVRPIFKGGPRFYEHIFPGDQP